MRQEFKRLSTALILMCAGIMLPAFVNDHPQSIQIQEERWILPVPLPMRGYVVRPVGDGPFPLVVMNHGISRSAEERGYFPPLEFRDAALWFARRGNLVVVPIRPGYGESAADIPELGIYAIDYTSIGECSHPDFRDPGLAIAEMDEWVIDYMVREGLALPDGVIVVGQSGGGWGAIALSSKNPAAVRALITFEAGRGGDLGGKPNNNCAPDKLVEATREFGRTSRIPMLWLYTENDTFFGPALSKRMHEAFSGAGGNAEYHLLPAFRSEGHFLIDSPDALAIWTPLVSHFLDQHR